VLVLVGGQFVALLAGANQDSELIQNLYDWSEFWVSRLQYVRSRETRLSRTPAACSKPASLIAFAVYLIIGAFVSTILSGAAFARFRHA